MSKPKPEPVAGEQAAPEPFAADEATADTIRRQWDDSLWSRSPTPRYRP